MLMPRSGAFLSASLEDVVPTNAGAHSPTIYDHGRNEELREKWQSLIDHKLIEWGRDPSQLDDEGIEPPAVATIQLAIAWAKHLKDEGLSPPDSVVPDPNGGIVFERREGDIPEEFHVWDDGTVEYCGFENATLFERRTLYFEATSGRFLH